MLTIQPIVITDSYVNSPDGDFHIDLIDVNGTRHLYSMSQAVARRLAQRISGLAPQDADPSGSAKEKCR